MFDPPSATGDGEDINLGGQQGDAGQDQVVGREDGAGQRNESLVPYLDVLAEYQDRATRTIERAGYPTRLRGLVRDYFDIIGGVEP